MASCGVWMSRRRLVTAVVDGDGAVVLVGAARRDDDSRRDMLFTLEGGMGLDGPLVVTESMLAADALPRLAAGWGVRVLVAPDALVQAALHLTGRAHAAPRALALLLARMPASAPFAERLRRLKLQLSLPLA